VRLSLAENAGAFLGLGRSLSDAARRAIFVGAVGAALLAALVWLLRTRSLPLGRTLAAAFMIGGGLANLLDRLPDDRVTDYILLSAGPLRTGIFNLADAAILAGAFAWMIGGVATRRASPEDPSSGA
jgi:signal peptidase II